MCTFPLNAQITAVGQVIHWPSKNLYSKEKEHFLENRRYHINHLGVAEIFGRTYFMALTIEAAINVFRRTGPGTWSIETRTLLLPNCNHRLQPRQIYGLIARLNFRL
jgi:hypothetical protein